MIQTKFALLLFLIPCIGTISSAQTDQASPTETKQESKSVEIKITVKQNFLLYLPEDYDSKDKHPLMLFLHGAGERGSDLEQVKKHGPPKHIEAGKQFPCIVVSPQCRPGTYWDNRELVGLLDYVEANYKVDKQRIYVTGLSMGGYGTWALAMNQKDRFAAIAPICGGGDSDLLKRQNSIQIPTWVFHGAKDRVVRLEESQKMVDAMKHNNVPVKFTVYDEVGHNAWDPAYNDELYDWLLKQKRD